MSKIVGIDLGTTNSLVATVDGGIPYVIADADGRRLTPSVVHYPGNDSEPIVGATANRLRSTHPATTFYSIKRFMGRRVSEITPDEKDLPFEFTGQAGGPVGFATGGSTVLPEEISSQILKKLKDDASAHWNEPITRAVITVPAYFNDAQRNATKRAGELAGLVVERILNEPTAAALAYGLDRLQENSKIAVYDLGGGTFDLSILEMHQGVFQVLSTHGNTRLGGDDLDRALTHFIVDEIRSRNGPDVAADPIACSRVRDAAEEAKIALSTAESFQINLPFLTTNFSFSYTLTRPKLEELTHNIVAGTRSHCIRALADAKLDASDLAQVILVGGQTRMPLVRRLVSEWFGCAEFEEVRGDLRLGAEYHKPKGPTLNTSQNPDEAVALGAAFQAEILSGGFKNMLLLDVTPLSLGLETFGGLMNVIIPRNSTIPVKAGEMFTTAVDHQQSMLIHILQGERERAKDNWSLGKFTLEFESAPRGVPRIGVQFEIDANGILHVLARDIKTGLETVQKIHSTIDVDDRAVQQMVEESVEHAFEDLAARRWVEAKLKASETIQATENALLDCADEMEPEALASIQSALATTRQELAREDPTTQTGDPKALVGVLAELDEMTRPLAELLMDKSIAQLLRKKGLLKD